MANQSITTSRLLVGGILGTYRNSSGPSIELLQTRRHCALKDQVVQDMVPNKKLCLSSFFCLPVFAGILALPLPPVLLFDPAV